MGRGELRCLNWNEYDVFTVEHHLSADLHRLPVSVSSLSTNECAGAAGRPFVHALSSGNCGLAAAGTVVVSVCAGWAALFQ